MIMGKYGMFYKIFPAIMLFAFLLNSCITQPPSIIDHRVSDDLNNIFKGQKISESVQTPSVKESRLPVLSLDKPLSLDEAVSLALLKNQRIRIALRNEGIADDTQAQVLSQYYPFIDIRAGFTTRSNDPGLTNPDTGVDMVSGERDVFSGSVFANYLLTDFGGRYYRLKGAQLDAAISRIVSLDEYRKISFEVAEAYFNLLEARHFYKVAEDSHHLFAKQLKVSRDMYDNELVAKNDVLSAEIGYARAQQTLITAENNIALSEAGLNFVLGIDIDNATQIRDVTEIPKVSLDYQRLLLVAVDNRPELMRLRKEKQKAEASLKGVKSEFAPSIIANAGIRSSSDDYHLNKEYVTAGIFLQWELIKGGKIPARIRQARRFVEQIEERIQLQDRAVALEVKSAFLRIEENRKNIMVAKRAVAQSEENLEIFQDQYKFNLVSITDVLAAQNSLTRSRFNYFATLYDYYQSLAHLESAVGIRIFSRDGEIQKEN